MAIIFGCLLALLLIFVVWMITRKINEVRQFMPGHNPYSRICKDCGAHQHQYRSNIEGQETDVWWEEVYPIGNDPNCKCHKYAEHR